jgi:hypothetical protein
LRDWTGGFFVYGANIKQVLEFLQSYDQHKVTFYPDITDSKIRKRNGPDEFEVYLRIVKSKSMVTDVLNSEHKDLTWTHPCRKPAPSAAVLSTRVAAL